MPLGKRRGRGHDAWWDAWSGGRARWEWTLELVPTLCVEGNDVVVSMWERKETKRNVEDVTRQNSWRVEVTRPP